MSYSITLPWPSKDLSPNARVHWARKNRAARKARADAKIACLAAGARSLGWDGADLIVTFRPPGNYQYDHDNLVARSKALFDGIADATGINDRGFHFEGLYIGDTIKGGEVSVVLFERRPVSVGDPDGDREVA